MGAVGTEYLRHPTRAAEDDHAPAKKIRPDHLASRDFVREAKREPRLGKQTILTFSRDRPTEDPLAGNASDRRYTIERFTAHTHLLGVEIVIYSASKRKSPYAGVMPIRPCFFLVLGSRALRRSFSRGYVTLFLDVGRWRLHLLKRTLRSAALGCTRRV